MRVIVKIAAKMKAITIVSAGGIAGGRDSYALIGNASTGELADHPAIGNMVVEDYRIAVATTQADAGEASPNRTDRSWRQDRGSRCLVKDLIAHVVIFNVLSHPNGPVGIGRCTTALIDHAVKIENGGGHDFRDQMAE